MDGFKKRTLEKQKAIIYHAYELFKERGMKHTNIQDIAKHAQVSQVTIYNYFKNKDGVFVEVVKKMLKDEEEALKKLFHSDLSFKDKLETFIRREVTRYDFIHPDFVEVLNDQHHPTLNALYDLYMKEVFAPLLIQLINEGKAINAIEHTYSDAAIMHYLQLFKHIRDYHIYENQALLKEIMQMFLYGLTGRD